MQNQFHGGNITFSTNSAVVDGHPRAKKITTKYLDVNLTSYIKFNLNTDTEMLKENYKTFLNRGKIFGI